MKQSGKIIGRKFGVDTYITGFLHTVFFLSLVVATPLMWKRKIFALSLGFVLITCFVMLKIRVLILHGYDVSSGAGLDDAPAHESYSFWYNYFVKPMTPGYYFAIILWLIVYVSGKKNGRN